MTTHFAYPNVIPKQAKFIGCGRYSVFRGETFSNPDYCEITDTPNTPNKSALDHALQLTAPDSFDSSLSVFEIKDQKERTYQGDSLDLAFYLAHINRSRKIVGAIEGDIWCTGVIKVAQSLPVLRKVDPIGFEIKLSHFITSAKNDTVFIVPAANMTKPCIQQVEKANIRILSLSQLESNDKFNFNENKTIIKVLPNELPTLIDSIFDSRANEGKGKLTKWVAVFMICVFGIAGWFYYDYHTQVPTLEQITGSIEKGDIQNALSLLGSVPTKDPTNQKLNALMNLPQKIDISFEYKRGGDDRSGFRVIDSGKFDNLTLTHTDLYRFKIESSVRTPSFFVYVFQTDQIGNLDRLFPDPAWPHQNPVNINRWPIRIPPGNDQWLFLDRLPIGSETKMTETIHVLVSPWRAQDIEMMISTIDSLTDRPHRQQSIKELNQKLISRKQANIPSVKYKQYTFLHQ